MRRAIAVRGIGLVLVGLGLAWLLGVSGCGSSSAGPADGDAGIDAADASADADADAVDAGTDAGPDSADAGSDPGTDPGPPIAQIAVNFSQMPKQNSPLVNASGIEIESNAQGLGAQLLMDRGFEWDPAFLQQALGWQAWPLILDTGVQASASWVTDHVYQGTHAMKVAVTVAPQGKLALLGQGGRPLVTNRVYEFSFWAYHAGNPPVAIGVILANGDNQQPVTDPVIFQLDAAPGTWMQRTAEFTPTASAKNGTLLISVSGVSEVWLDSVSLAPKDTLHGIWPELTAAYRDAKIAAVRLGGISADGYDWRAGLGSKDKRGVLRSAFADTSLDTQHIQAHVPYYNDVGTDEFLDFCRDIGAEALLTANFPLGARAAANWVQYVNGTSPGLQAGIDRGWKEDSYQSTDEAPASYFAWLREFYGHQDPWSVKNWEIGNELWDEGLPEPGSLTGQPNLDNYAAQALAFAQAMKAEDPTILVGAVAEPTPEPGPTDYRSHWNQTVLQVAGDQIDYLAVHFYGPGDFDDTRYTAHDAFYLLAGIGPVYERELAKAQADIDAWKAQGHTHGVGIAMTEYNIWHGILSFQDPYAVNSLRSVLGAATFKTANLRGKTWMANFYNMIGTGFGMLEWDAPCQAKGQPSLGGDYLLQKLFADHFTPRLHPVTVQAPSYSVTSMFDPPVIEAPVLDAAAGSGDDGNRMVLLVVNRSFDNPDGIRTAFDLGGFVGTGAKAFVLTGKDSLAHNTPDDQTALTIQEEDLPPPGAAFNYTLRPFSVTAIEILR